MGITVYTTAPDEASSEEIAKECVEAGLATCCNFWPVRTIYSWEGKLKDDTEHIIFIKTSKEKFEELQNIVTIASTGNYGVRGVQNTGNI